MQVLRVEWAQAADHLRPIREEVFVREQKVPESLEWDGLDELPTVHFLVLRSGLPVGCARLLPNGQIGRMAVRAPWRGQGIGCALLDAAVAEARRQKLPEVFLYAQVHALAFYAAAGFRAEGEHFLDAGIEHVLMRLPASHLEDGREL